jgi:hypothetical protein
VKVVLMHGGKYYGSGNNLKGLMEGANADTKEGVEANARLAA